MQEQDAVEARARCAAKRVGLYAKKSRWRRDTYENHGKFMLMEPSRGYAVAGFRFDMDAEEVIVYCKEYQ